MSTARMSAPEPRSRPDAAQRRDMAELQERRRVARRNTRVLRLDLALGVLAAIILLLTSPGLAITGVAAFVLLVGVFGSITIERRRRRKRSSEPARRPRQERRR